MPPEEEKLHETGWGKGMSPAEIALWSSMVGGAGGFIQGNLLYDDPKLIAAKTGFGALSSAGLGYTLAKLNPALQSMSGMVPQIKTSAALQGYAEGFFEVWENSLR